MVLRETITSRNNELVKWASSLSDKKGRDISRSFIVEGKKLSFEALDARLSVTHVFVLEGRKDEYMPTLKEKLGTPCYENVEIVLLSESAFSKISTEKSPQGIISVIKYLDFFSDLDIIYNEAFYFNEKERAIILSSVRDPGNLGAVIRSSVAFGVERIILSSDTADVYNPKTVRAAMGSLFKVKIDRVSSLRDFIPALRKSGRRVFAAELSEGAVSLSDLDLRPDDVFMIGNEGHGIDPELSSISDGSVYIPISGKTESLNAAVAAAVFMWEQSK